jgi:hypothetical protein
MKPDWDAPPGSVDAATLGAGPLPADEFEPQTPSASEALRPQSMCRLRWKWFGIVLSTPQHDLPANLALLATWLCMQSMWAQMAAAHLLSSMSFLQATAAWSSHLMPAARQVEPPHATCNDQVNAASSPLFLHVIVTACECEAAHMVEPLSSVTPGEPATTQADESRAAGGRDAQPHAADAGASKLRPAVDQPTGSQPCGSLHQKLVVAGQMYRADLPRCRAAAFRP